MVNFISGIYFLKVTNGNNEVKIFKIIKTQWDSVFSQKHVVELVPIAKRIGNKQCRNINQCRWLKDFTIDASSSHESGKSIKLLNLTESEGLASV